MNRFSTLLPQRIVVIASYAPSLINFRGALLRELRAQGHQVVALAPGPAPEVAGQLAAWGVHYQQISLERTGMNLGRDWRDVRALTAQLRALRPDLVLAYTIKPVIYGLLAARLAGVNRRYALITGLGYSFQGEGLKRRLLSLLTSNLYRVALLGARRVIFQNPDDLALFLLQRLVKEQQTALVNGSGVDMQQFVPTPLPDAPVFLLIARLLREKGIGEYVQAAQQVRQDHPQARFLLAGPLDPSPGAYSQAEVDSWVRSGAVEYLGELGDVRPALESCRVYVLPSYREGTPRTVLEAMAMGRAVITTDAPGCRQTVREGVNGYLVPVGDSSALANRMAAFITQPELAVQMGEAGLIRVHGNYNVHQVNRNMLQFLDLVLHLPVKIGPPKLHTRRLGDSLKRALDIVVSTTALCVLSVPLLVLAALIKWRLGSPVLFCQQRPGLHAKPFMLIKFKSMTSKCGPDGELLPDAQRLTRFGRMLRSSSLDELPGLWNVLRGEMSLVGPRPLLVAYLPLYSDQQAHRHDVRPGITGWAQVNGRNAISWQEKFQLDVWYVNHRTFALDLKILGLTVLKVIQRSDISASGDATMPPFRGNDSEKSN